MRSKRRRSTIKWAGTVLTVLLLVVWVPSVWWATSFFLKPTGGVGVFAGLVRIAWDEPWSAISEDCSWSAFARHPIPLSWWFAADRGVFPTGETRTAVDVPIWVLALLFGTPTLWLWRCDRRRQPGLCIKCGYDLRGADHKVCPECGTPPPRPSPAEPEEGVESAAT